MAKTTGATADEPQRAAFEKFVATFDGRLRRLVAPRLGARGPELDDAIQAAYEALWLQPDPLADDARALAFCLAVASNFAKGTARRAESRVARPGGFADDAAGVAPDPADVLVHHESVRRRLEVAAEAFASLTARQQEVWRLVEVEGLAHKDAAKLLHSTPAAVEATLRRARAALRRHAERLGPLLAGVALSGKALLRRSRHTLAVAPSYVVLGAVVLAFVGPPARHGVEAMPEPFHDALARPGTRTSDEPPPEAPRRRHRPLSPPGAPDSAALSRPKLAGCFAVACVNGARSTGEGHGLWVRLPAVQGVGGREYELWQTEAPVCNATQPAPDNDVVGCRRYGPTHAEQAGPAR